MKEVHEITWEEAPEKIELSGEVLEEILEAFAAVDEVRKQAKEALPGLYNYDLGKAAPPLHESYLASRYTNLVNAHLVLAWETVYRYHPICIYQPYDLSEDRMTLTKRPESKERMMMEKMQEIIDIMSQGDGENESRPDSSK